MGLYILKKKHLKKRTDFLKLKFLLQNIVTRKLIEDLLKPESNGQMKLENLLNDYAQGNASSHKGGLRQYALYKILDMSRQALGVPRDRFEKALAHPSIQRTIVNGLLSLQEYGVTFPQRFAAPLMVVWNFTYACNLKCKHCYEDAGILRPAELRCSELTLDEKLRIVDEIAQSYIPTLSFSGGEPLIHKDFWPVAKRASEQGLYLSINTNGTLITKEVAQRLADLDFAYVAISLDAPNGEVHDQFRGVPGAWEKSVEGIKNMVAAGVETVLSFTLTQYNAVYLKDMFKLADDWGLSKVMIYNFIPTGRGKEIIDGDLTPQMREEALELMYEYSLNGKSLCTTAPQFGRVCKEQSRPDLIPLCHTGPGRGKDLPILADLIGGCGVGRAYCALQPDGRITPCVYMPDVTIGHIRENTILEVWRNSPLLKMLADRGNLKGHCGKCDYKEVCGGCRARALAYFGDLQAPDPGCINNQEYYEQIRSKFLQAA